MHKKHSSSHKKPRLQRSRHTLAVAFSIAAIGVLGASYLASSQAATYAVTAQAESATLAGNASKVSDTNASASSAVKFGGTGGTDVSACTATSSMVLKDQDTSDSQSPWKRTNGQKAIINFETGRVNAEILGYMQYSAANWNKSPCLDVRLVSSCTGVARCITVRQLTTSPEDDDGNFDDVTSGGYTTGGDIQIYTGMPDMKNSPGARKNVTVHEMGHAVGLRHRLTNRVLMNGDTYDNVFDSDATDYHNLLVSYGKQNNP